MRRALLVALALVAGGCFSYQTPMCSFACADTDPKCPPDYQCLSDGYCHLHGMAGSCGYSDAAMQPGDISVSMPADLSMPDLATVGPDSASFDLAGTD